MSAEGRGGAAAERRRAPRRRVELTVYVRKHLPDGRSSVFCLRSVDLSAGGLYLGCGDLALFDPGESVELMVDADGRYHAADAQVVRSARTREDRGGGGARLPSGFGVRFVAPGPPFRAMVERRVRPR